MGEDSRSRGCEFESQHRMVDGRYCYLVEYFSHYFYETESSSYVKAKMNEMMPRREHLRKYI